MFPCQKYKPPTESQVSTAAPVATGKARRLVVPVRASISTNARSISGESWCDNTTATIMRVTRNTTGAGVRRAFHHSATRRMLTPFP